VWTERPCRGEAHRPAGRSCLLVIQATEERWEAIELMRRINYGPATANDFKEFLRLLNFHEVEYLLIGGYAVGHYGYPRATVDMDVWVAISPENARRVVAALEAFGFSPGSVSSDLFLAENQIVRLGVPPTDSNFSPRSRALPSPSAFLTENARWSTA